MANENDTFEQVCEKCLTRIREAWKTPNGFARVRMETMLCEVKEAHKCEIADEQKWCANILREQIAEVERAAKVIAARDAEIKRLKQEVTGLQLQMWDDDLLKMANDIDRKDAEIAKLRSLVKKLAKYISSFKDGACLGCQEKTSVCEKRKCLLVKKMLMRSSLRLGRC